MKWGEDRLTPILEAASKSINPLVSPASLEKNARDRLKATIASKAYEGAKAGKPADELLFGLVLESMRGDMRRDSQSGRKERK